MPACELGSSFVRALSSSATAYAQYTPQPSRAAPISMRPTVERLRPGSPSNSFEATRRRDGLASLAVRFEGFRPSNEVAVVHVKVEKQTIDSDTAQES